MEIGHTLRKPQGTLTRQTLSWNPQGTRKKGRPKNSRRRDLEEDRSNIGKSWRELETLAKNRRTWNVIVAYLCPHGSKGQQQKKNNLRCFQDIKETLKMTSDEVDAFVRDRDSFRRALMRAAS
jgi:hypothetical protein